MTLSPFSFVRQNIDSLCQAASQRLRQWTKPDNRPLLLNAALDLTRSKPELVLENMLLRQQLIMLKRQVKRPALTWRDRALFVLLASKVPTWKEVLVIVQPETVLRWHRELFRWVWRRKSRPRKRGRPVLAEKCHPLRDRLFTVNNPNGLFTVNNGSFERIWIFGQHTCRPRWREWYRQRCAWLLLR